MTVDEVKFSEIFVAEGFPLSLCFGGVYVPCIYSHARRGNRRRFSSLLLCPLSVGRYYFPLFVDSDGHSEIQDSRLLYYLIREIEYVEDCTSITI